jgi:hypothetical protein
LTMDSYIRTPTFDSMHQSTFLGTRVIEKLYLDQKELSFVAFKKWSKVSDKFSAQTYVLYMYLHKTHFIFLPHQAPTIWQFFAWWLMQALKCNTMLGFYHYWDTTVGEKFGKMPKIVIFATFPNKIGKFWSTQKSARIT